MSLALPIAASRRGACPSLDAPMQTGDGLLARIRIAGGRIDPVRLEQLAVVCGTYGNGVMEITARGNLQVRGLVETAVAPFARDVRNIVEVETGLVVQVPPLAGDDPLEFIDPRPLADGIKALSAPLSSLLGPKVAVIVDGNGQFGLKTLNADLRLLAVGPDRWLLSAGSRLLGTTSQPLECARIFLTALANLGRQARANNLDQDSLDAALGDRIKPSAWVDQARNSAIDSFVLRRGRAIGLGLPFGSIAWESMAALADGAWRFGISEFRLAPQHGIIAIGADQSLLGEAAEVGFITHPLDPRTRISACIGSEGCASGHIPARAVAARLARSLPAGSTLHVSGCNKGCAHPRPADVTLVGQAGGYGLVIHGAAGDTPQAVLRADQLETALAFGQG